MAALSSSVRLPNGSKLPISHIGSVTLTPSITLSNVLCVPHFQFNLLSVLNLSRLVIILSHYISVFAYSGPNEWEDSWDW